MRLWCIVPVLYLLVARYFTHIYYTCHRFINFQSHPKIASSAMGSMAAIQSTPSAPYETLNLSQLIIQVRRWAHDEDKGSCDIKLVFHYIFFPFYVAHFWSYRMGSKVLRG